MANTIYGVLYSFITLLPIMLVFDSTILELFIFPVILVGVFIPVFIMYGKKNIYNFEDSEKTITSQVVIVPLSISIALYFIIPISVLTGLILIILYNFVLFDNLIDYSDKVVIKVKYIHLNFVNNFVNSILILKLIALLFIIFLGYFHNPIVWFCSFIFDLYSKYWLRNELYTLNIIQQGFSIDTNSKQRDIFAYIIMFISTILSVLFSRSKAILPYTKIIDFLNSLFSFEGDVTRELQQKGNSNMYRMDQQIGIPFELLDDSTGTSKLFDLFLMIAEKILYIGLSILIIYFLFYPLIAPLFKMNVKKTSLKEYYLQVLNTICCFFKGIKKAFIDIFKKRENDSSLYSDIKNISSYSYSSKTLKDHREIKVLLKYYFKLVKWSNKKSGYRGARLSINEFFIQLDITDFEIEFSRLNNFFNIGFFSDRQLSRSELRDIKNILKVVIKK